MHKDLASNDIIKYLKNIFQYLQSAEKLHAWFNAKWQKFYAICKPVAGSLSISEIKIQDIYRKHFYTYTHWPLLQCLHRETVLTPWPTPYQFLYKKEYTNLNHNGI